MRVTVPTCVGGEWIVRNIELYADDACEQLIADDISFERDLSPSQQLTIIAALNAYAHEKEQEKFATRVAYENSKEFWDREQEKDYERDAL